MKLLSACRAARGPSPDVGSVLSKAGKDESMSLAEGWGAGGEISRAGPPAWEVEGQSEKMGGTRARSGRVSSAARPGRP